MQDSTAVIIAAIGAVCTLGSSIINHYKIKENHAIAVDTKSVVDGRLGQFLSLADKVTRHRHEDRDPRWVGSREVSGQRRDDPPDSTRTFRRSWSERMESGDSDWDSSQREHYDQ